MQPTIQPEYQLTPLSLFSPSPTNPRSRISQAEIESLAASIEPHGVVQPVLARPRPDAQPGEPPLELVAGHRRWTATSWLEERGRNPHQGCIPALRRELTDAQVLALQLIENIQREDLHPLDEAAHYRRMRDATTGALSVEEIAALGKVSVSRVYERLSLLSLVPAAREAFLAGQLTLKTALLVARMPAEQQAEVTVHLADWGGEPMTPKAAATFIRERYMLRLAQAPFDPADATLLPAAGACGACPKRTGANPQLFGDISEADTCTDTVCFGNKKAAQRSRLVDELRATGYRVLQDDEARDVCTADGRALKPTLLSLDAQVPHHLGDSSLKVAEVLDKAKVPTHAVLAIDHPSAATAPVVAVGVHVLEGALRRIKAHREQLEKRAERAARPAPPAPAPAPAADPAAEAGSSLVAAFEEGIAQEAARQDFVRALLDFKPEPTWYLPKNAALLERITKEQESRVLRILAAGEVGEAMQGDGAEGLPPYKLAQMLCVLLSWDDGAITLSEAAYLAGVPHPFPRPAPDAPFGTGARTFRAKQEWLWTLADEEAARIAMVLLASQEHRGDSPVDHFTEAVLCGMNIPLQGLVVEAQKLVAERIRLGAVEHGKPAEAKPKAAAKKPAKTPAKLPYRYRNPLTGETWTGRGLQPKWLKVALENGAKLADFDLHAGGGQ